MENLSIDFKSLLPYVIDAFINVYGEEYRDIISKRINSAVIIPYYDINGLRDYILCIERYKRREYAIKFLDKIGIDVKKYIRDNYTKPLEQEVEKELEYYMDSSFAGFGNNVGYWVSIQAFKSDNRAISSARLLENKIKIINHLLDDGHEQITEENFNLFAETQEYCELLKKIDKINIIYEQLLLEYRKWEEKLKPYKDFVEFEDRRKSEILENYKMSLYLDISSRLPKAVIDVISDKLLEERSSAVLGSLDIGEKSNIESFGSSEMKKLRSNDVALLEKYLIVHSQTSYLKKLGIKIDDEKMLECDSEEDVNNYLNFLNQNNIRKYIPSDDLIRYITFVRESKYEEAIKEYYVTRKDFIDAINVCGNTEENKKYVYGIIKDRRVCIAGGGATTSLNEFISIMFYTIRTYDSGMLFHVFMHECGHIIDQSIKGTGFESINDFNSGSERNIYDKAFRKYERFNETLNDIFTMEAVSLLQKQGVYLIEPQEYTLNDTNDHNSALITKKILYPLVSNFRSQVIRAKVNAEPNELIRYIGKDNFEELVDVVNKVDYLTRNGLIFKLDTSPEDEMVKEYFKQVERVNQIYNNIDVYFKNIIPYSINLGKLEKNIKR